MKPLVPRDIDRNSVRRYAKKYGLNLLKDVWESFLEDNGADYFQESGKDYTITLWRKPRIGKTRYERSVLQNMLNTIRRS